MLGKKKKEEAPVVENDLDKPQTLAELDAMAREKKDGKVVLEDGDDPEGEADSSTEHEHTHSDEQTADVGVVRRVTGSQKRLWLLVWFAVIILIVGGAFFYSQIEDGEGIGIGAGGSGSIVQGGEDEIESDLPQGTYAYVAQAGQSKYVRENLEDQAETEIELGASISSKAESFQLSSNSTSYAVNTGSGIFVKTASKEHTLLVEQSSRMRDWLLIPDGTRVYALVGNALWVYDTNTAEGGEVAADFSPPGTDASRLGYSRDGSLFIYSKNAGLLTGSIYEPNSGEVSKVEKEVIRLSKVGEFQRASVSPDGSSIVFFADISGNPTLQLLSLNSYVLRTVYVAESGNRPQAFEWSEDSNNVVVYETGATPLIGNLKVGTLEKEILLQNPGNVSSLTWAPDKERVAYIAGGKLIALDLENKEPKTLIESVQADSFTGWFQN